VALLALVVNLAALVVLGTFLFLNIHDDIYENYAGKRFKCV
jgi:hypothetical protein